jgi:hypothetical protein
MSSVLSRPTNIEHVGRCQVQRRRERSLPIRRVIAAMNGVRGKTKTGVRGVSRISIVLFGWASVVHGARVDLLLEIVTSYILLKL